MLPPNKIAPDGDFGIRDTLILTGAERLTLQNDLPLPDPVQGATLILDGLYPSLQDGQVVVVSGNLFDPSQAGSLGDAATEVCRLVGPPLQDATNGLTTVQLKAGLQNQYVRSTTVVMANVVSVTQGETVNDEVLGSGDGSALQSYTLKKHPLTYLPATDPQGTSSVQSTLIVTVNGVRWQEQASLFDSGPTDQDFTVTQDDSARAGLPLATAPTGCGHRPARTTSMRVIGLEWGVPATSCWPASSR